MPINRNWLDKMRRLDDLDSRDTLKVERVPLTLPIGRSDKDRARSWRRRVLEDIVPDYPNQDVPEKMLYRILRQLTDPQQTNRTLREALESDFEPVIPLYETHTVRQQEVPVAFHVLAVKSMRGRLRCRLFKENTFLLLCRDREGNLDETLVTEFVERFRKPPEEIELSQSLVVDQLHPGWRPDHEFTVNLEPFRAPMRPFLYEPAQLFQRDLRTLLRVEVPHSYFLSLANQVLALHLGLYQSRLAQILNPALSLLCEVADKPAQIDVTKIEELEDGRCDQHQFAGRYAIRSPDLTGKRRLSLNAPARESYLQIERELVDLHFSILMLNRIREAAKCYLRETRNLEDETALDEMVRLPSQIAERLRSEEAFRRFILRAFETMSTRFVLQEVPEERQEEAWELLRQSPNGLIGMNTLYKFEERVRAGTRSKHRAVVTGTRVFRALLENGDSSVVNTRSGVGRYLELGTGLIPLLLLLVVRDNEKIQLAKFWEGLAEYGLQFSQEDRELLLARLKMMGLYERFSDAGEANYVRSLMQVA